MKITPLRYLTCCLLISLSSTKGVCAEFVGHGKVRMQGAVIEAACAIDIDSRDQTIDMSILPVSQLLRDGQSKSHWFTINLVNCFLHRVAGNQPDWSHFQIMFDGPIDHGLFSVQGLARGVALQISDATGNIATPGENLPDISFVGGTQKLNYSLRLMGNQQKLRVGNYNSTIRFRMNYYWLYFILLE